MVIPSPKEAVKVHTESGRVVGEWSDFSGYGG